MECDYTYGANGTQNPFIPVTNCTLTLPIGAIQLSLILLVRQLSVSCYQNRMKHSQNDIIAQRKLVESFVNSASKKQNLKIHTDRVTSARGAESVLSATSTLVGSPMDYSTFKSNSSDSVPGSNFEEMLGLRTTKKVHATPELFNNEVDQVTLQQDLIPNKKEVLRSCRRPVVGVKKGTRAKSMIPPPIASQQQIQQPQIKIVYVPMPVRGQPVWKETLSKNSRDSTRTSEDNRQSQFWNDSNSFKDSIRQSADLPRPVIQERIDSLRDDVPLALLHQSALNPPKVSINPHVLQEPPQSSHVEPIMPALEPLEFRRMPAVNTDKFEMPRMVSNHVVQSPIVSKQMQPQRRRPISPKDDTTMTPAVNAPQMTHTAVAKPAQINRKPVAHYGKSAALSAASGTREEIQSAEMQAPPTTEQLELELELLEQELQYMNVDSDSSEDVPNLSLFSDYNPIQESTGNLMDEMEIMLKDIERTLEPSHDVPAPIVEKTVQDLENENELLRKELLALKGNSQN